MLDEFGTDNPDDYIAGFPDHPHRGFETVTYMLDGHMQHKDSGGLTLQFDFIPADLSTGRIVVRVRSEKPAEGNQGEAKQ